MKRRFLATLQLAFLASPLMWAQVTRQMNVYSEGKLVYTADVETIDSVTFQEVTKAPVADILDVIFKADGTAEDISPMKNPVTIPSSGGLSTVWSNTYNRYVARFSNAWGGSASGYYKVDYTNNEQFRKALADGHTLEVLVMGEFTGAVANVEAKPFSSMQSGGTGFLVTTVKGDRKNELCFLPNISTSGSSTWRWATSGIVPQGRRFYHLVGVWNKEEQKAYVYVDGQLCNTVNASGEMVFPTSGATWFCIGADPSNATAAHSGWAGDIVLARIYDKPLVAEEVAALWDEVDEYQANAEPDMVTDVDYLSGMAVKAGSAYAISGKGFAEGDKIQLIAPSGDVPELTADLQLTADGVRLSLPADLTSGTYRLMLVRGDKRQDLGQTTFSVVEQMPRGCKVIAHRGHWNVAGAAQNSRRSLQNALDLGVYGSETDIWITADGCLMVNHDASFGGVKLETATAEQCQALTLSNGEKMPRFEEFLEMMQAYEGPTKLIIEIKTHADAARGQAAADSTVAMVRRMGLQDRVEYIAFSLDICRRIVYNDSTAHVAYLNGDKSPATLHEYGIMGLDYTAAKMRSNPTWVSEAHELGMTTNVWTINSQSEIIEMSNMDHDFVTTNDPELAARILRYYEGAQ